MRISNITLQQKVHAFLVGADELAELVVVPHEYLLVFGGIAFPALFDLLLECCFQHVDLLFQLDVLSAVVLCF